MKVKIFRSAVVNIQVQILHGASTFWEKIFILSETRTYLLSFNAEKCIYIMFSQAKITF